MYTDTEIYIYKTLEMKVQIKYIWNIYEPKSQN